MWRRARRRPALGPAPVVGGITGAVLDPGTRRIKHRRLVEQRARFTLQPIAEPGEIRVARPEIVGIDKIVLVGADPQFLRAGARLDVLERGDDAGLENVE